MRGARYASLWLALTEGTPEACVPIASRHQQGGRSHCERQCEFMVTIGAMNGCENADLPKQRIVGRPAAFALKVSQTKADLRLEKYPGCLFESCQPGA
jgi:hypothetical protein